MYDLTRYVFILLDYLDQDRKTYFGKKELDFLFSSGHVNSPY
jgi:hypothetical protein